MKLAGGYVHIRHLHISHNAHYLPPPPKFCITFVFHFSWVLQPFQEKLKTMLMQNFGGQIRCNFGRCASGVLAGGNPCTWPLVTALCDYALPEHWLVILNARTIWKNLNLAEENWFEQDAKISPFTLSSSKMRLIASIDSFPGRNVKGRVINEWAFKMNDHHHHHHRVSSWQ